MSREKYGVLSHEVLLYYGARAFNIDAIPASQTGFLSLCGLGSEGKRKVYYAHDFRLQGEKNLRRLLEDLTGAAFQQATSLHMFL